MEMFRLFVVVFGVFYPKHHTNQQN